MLGVTYPLIYEYLFNQKIGNPGDTPEDAEGKDAKDVVNEDLGVKYRTIKYRIINN